MTSDPFIDGLRAALRAATVVAERLTSLPAWIPEAGSLGAAELANTEAGARGAWGERPVRTAYAAACMGIKVAAEYAGAIEVILTPRRSPLVPEGNARGALEAGASAWWLLEGGLGARRRVCRLQLYRIKSALELANAVTEVGVSNATGDYGETPDQVRDYSHELGLGPFHDKGRDSAAICETETRPRYTERARALLTDWGMKGAYNIYSGTAHAELYAVVRSFERAPLRPAVSRSSGLPQTRSCCTQRCMRRCSQ